MIFSHDKSGQFELKKTSQLIGRHFFWPNSQGIISDFVKSCPGCQTKKRKTVFDRVPNRPQTRPDSAFEIIAVDIWGPITPPSSAGDRYILGIICLNTRWIDCYPLRSLKVTEVCENLLKFFSYASYPQCIISPVHRIPGALYRTMALPLYRP